jgi:choline dehydrogenase
MDTYTDIVIGAGSAGAVIASRLSEDPRARILLIEAGPDYPAFEDLPDDVRNGNYPSFEAHDWGLLAEAVPGRLVPYTRGKLVGGSSAVNTSMAIWPDPEDFAEWEALGNPGWGWADMAPVLRRIENDGDFDLPGHGRAGRIPVRRWREDELIPLQRALLDIGHDLGYDELADINSPGGSGVGLLPMNLVDGVRMSTALTYLAPDVRARSNLDIRPNTLVDRIVFDDGTPTGVLLADGEEVRAERITLSAGSVGTPAILLRSGIGPADELRSLGIKVIADRPGVGRNLRDHPAALITLMPKPGVCDMANPVCQVLLRFNAPGSPDHNDMQIYVYSQVDLSSYAKDLNLDLPGNMAFMVSVGLERPESIGELRITSTDPAEAPNITLNFLGTPEDRRRMREGMRIGWTIANDERITRHATAVISPDRATIDSDDDLDEFLRNTCVTHYHPVGTARMGEHDDVGAVVDSRCRVHGFPALRIADASIMPTIPRANTNFTTIAIGERVAQWLRDELAQINERQAP